MKFEEVDKKELKNKITELKKKGYTRVNSISGVDVGDSIEVIYHLSKSGKELLNLKTKVSKKNSQVETIQDILPGAVLLERELGEMLGVRVKGNEFERLFLPENYTGMPPLRKKTEVKR